MVDDKESGGKYLSPQLQELLPQLAELTIVWVAWKRVGDERRDGDKRGGSYGDHICL